MIILEICKKQPFDIIAMTPREEPLCLCSHCPINDSSSYLHVTVYLAVMLQTSCVLQRVAKSQKVHISSHDKLQKLHNIGHMNINEQRSQGFLREGLEKQ